MTNKEAIFCRGWLSGEVERLRTMRVMKVMEPLGDDGRCKNGRIRVGRGRE